MLELLEQQKRLTTNQKKIVAAAVIGDMLDYFDFGLIGFALAFIVGPWQLTYGQSAMILLTSGIGGVPGALFYGWLADRIGRRTVFIITALNFSLATGVMALTPDYGGWIFLSVCRFFVGFGVAGLFTVDLPLVQEFVPTAKRGFIGGLVTSLLPISGIMGAALGAFATPIIGWRGLFAVGLLPAAVTLLIRAWVPESPRWLIRMGRLDDARRSLAWALKIDQREIELPTSIPEPQPTAWRELFRYPRSMALSVLTSLGCQAGGVGDRAVEHDPPGAAAQDQTRRGVVSDDLCGFCRLGRTLCLLLPVRRDWPPTFWRAAQLWRGLIPGACRILPRRLYRQRFGILSDAFRSALFWRWRLRRCRALCGGSLAVKTSGKRHGFRFWHRQFW